ncbi:MAG: TolC family protein, partial [Methylomonas sp.]
MMMLNACMPTDKAPPVDHYPPPLARLAVDSRDYQGYSNTLPSGVSSRPAEDNAIDTKQSYDLPALVDLALRTHPETKISWEEAKAAAARLERNRSAWYPTLTAMAFGQSFKTSFPIPGGPLVSRGYSSFGSLDLAWTLFDFGRREALVDAGAERLSAANFAFDRKHQEIAYRVTSSFFVYQAALAKVTAGQQAFESAKSNSASVRAKLDKGLATKPDLLLAIQEQAKASYDLQNARGSVTQARVELMANLGVSPAYSLQLTDLSKLSIPAELEASVEKIVDQALDQHPDLMARLAELRAREAEVKKARADFWPKISLRGMIGNQYWGSVHTNPPGNQS